MGTMLFGMLRLAIWHLWSIKTW